MGFGSHRIPERSAGAGHDHEGRDIKVNIEACEPFVGMHTCR